MSLQSAFISHQIWLQRYSTQEANTFEPYLRQLRNEIRAQVLGFGDDSRTKARLIVMLKDLENALYGITSDWDKQLLSDLKDLSIYESQFTAETLQKNVAANFTTPTPEQVWTAVKFQPLQLEGKPVDFTRLLASWSETEVSRLTMGVKTGFVQGLPTRQIVKQVIGDGSLIDVSERHVKAMVHTAIAHVSNQARETTYQKNNDIIEGYQWVSTLDRRTTTTCFTAETELTAIAGVNSVMRAEYSGLIFTVNLANGHKFAGTPKHPVLTQHGWTPIEELDPSKHILYTISDNLRVSVVDENINMPAKAHKIFDTLVKSPRTGINSVSSTAADFYGDGRFLNGKIDIISFDGKLRSSQNPTFSKRVKHKLFRRVHKPRFLARFSHSVLLSQRKRFGNKAPFSFTNGLDHSIKSRFRNSSSGQTRMGLIPQSKHLKRPKFTRFSLGRTFSPRDVLHEANLLEKISDSRGANTISISDSGSAHPLTVKATNIIGVTCEFRNCHVYTLSSSQGYYTAGSAIVKNCRARDGQKFYSTDDFQPKPPAHVNCRSTTAPLISSEFDFLDKGAKRAARGADGGQQVDADVTYYDFLAKQPAWFQDEALGPVRGKIFRNSGMTPEEFRVASVDGFGNPLTIKEMAALDKRVADYLSQGE